MIVVVSQTIEVPDGCPQEYLALLSESVTAFTRDVLRLGGPQDMPMATGQYRLVSSGVVRHPGPLMNLETGEKL